MVQSLGPEVLMSLSFSSEFESVPEPGSLMDPKPRLNRAKPVQRWMRAVLSEGLEGCITIESSGSPAASN